MDKKYGIIGCGMMGHEHVANINLLNGARVAAVYDPVRNLAQAASRKANGAPVFNAIKDIASAGLDALVIVSPNFRHVENLEEIARHTEVPILCEKPLYTDPAQEARLDAMVENHPSPIWVAMEYRYMPPVQAFLSEREITGGIKMLTIREHRIPFLPKIGNWNRFNRNSGGTFVEKCCHFFDLMRLILNAEPIRVSASAGQITNHLTEVYDGNTSDIWDGGYAMFDFDNGARAMLELCMFADGTMWNEEITAVGPKGKIETRIPGPQRLWPAGLGAPPRSEITLYPRSPKNPVTRKIDIDKTILDAGDHHGSTFYQHQKFLEVVCGTGEVEVSVEDGKRAVKMGLAAQKAALENIVVELAF
ncbi:MAG: Gfo/Idh/MocA family oxidoreductase [Hellea sp.]|nr:Gfo/Idh/MocA family oxidoreductase [Hellea sp.]